MILKRLYALHSWTELRERLCLMTSNTINQYASLRSKSMIDSTRKGVYPIRI
jgi:hypothetical protein